MIIRTARKLCLLLFFLPLLCLAQKPKDFGIKSKKALDAYLDGRQQAQWRTWDLAIEAFEDALALEPEFAEAHFHLGTALLVRERFKEALEHLEKANSLKPGAFGGMGYHLGQAYFYNERYAEAVPQYEAYLEEGRGGPSYVKTVNLNLRKALFAREAIQHPVAFNPVNLGSKVNSKEDDTMPYLTADEEMLLFMSRRPSSTGGYSRRLGGYPEDFFYCIKEEGEWKEAANLGPPINTPGNEGGPCLTQDGRALIFTACNQEGGLGNCDLYISYREGDNWSQPENLGPNVNSEFWDSQPCLSHDGKTLIFSSNRKGSYGGRDLWYSQKENGRWTAAQNLGDAINTVGNEDAPFLHADGLTLYFVSDYHNGFGDKDLFICFKYGEDQWSDPQNMGYPVNTASEEGYIFVNASGSRAYIGSTRDEGMGKNDIYVFDLDERVRPKRATFLRGLTRDSLTKTPVQARIRLLDVESGDTVRTIFSDRGNGKFLMSLPLEREYAALVEAPKYLFASKNFYLKDLDGETYFDLTVDLMPIKEGATVTLRNIFFEFGSFDLKETSKVELRFLLDYLNRNAGMRIEIAGHTDNVGSDDANLSLSQNRADAVRQYLISQGIAGDRIEAKGYGESIPVDTNDTEEGRAQNRRTEFKVLKL